MELCCLAKLCSTRKTVNSLAQTVDKLTLLFDADWCILLLICDKTLTKYEKQAVSFYPLLSSVNRRLRARIENSTSALELFFTYFFYLFTQ